MASKKKPKNSGAHGLRKELLALDYAINLAQGHLQLAMTNAQRVGATNQLAIAVKALRSIANSGESDNRSRGIAEATLEKMNILVVSS